MSKRKRKKKQEHPIIYSCTVGRWGTGNPVWCEYAVRFSTSDQIQDLPRSHRDHPRVPAPVLITEDVPAPVLRTEDSTYDNRIEYDISCFSDGIMWDGSVGEMKKDGRRFDPFDLDPKEQLDFLLTGRIKRSRFFPKGRT